MRKISLPGLVVVSLAWLLFASPVVLATANANSAAKSQEPLVVMAAASLTNVLPEVAAAWKAHGGQDVIFQFDGTSRLARQARAGAPADVFISADQTWMDYLAKENKIDPASRRTLLTNRLVAVVPATSKFRPMSAAELIGPQVKHLAVAGESVPAGRLARAALSSENVFEKVQDQLVNGDNVRAALQWVAKKEAEVGIVFETDARAEAKVKVAFVFPDKSHPKIEYPAAVLRGARQGAAAARFVAFCQSPPAKKIFEAAGFGGF